jgi:Flp pilus assembly protein TadG
MSGQWRQEHGQDIVEYALTLPLFVLLILGVLEFSVVIMAYDTIANAAREGARAGVPLPNSECNVACRNAEAVAAAEYLTTGLNPAELTITVTRPAGTRIRVQVSYDAVLVTAPMITAIGGSGTISLNAVTTMVLE